VEDLLVDSEILHRGEGGDVERWLEPPNKFFMFGIACVLFSISFHYLYCVVVHLAYYYCFHFITFIIGLYSSQ